VGFGEGSAGLPETQKSGTVQYSPVCHDVDIEIDVEGRFVTTTRRGCDAACPCPIRIQTRSTQRTRELVGLLGGAARAVCQDSFILSKTRRAARDAVL